MWNLSSQENSIENRLPSTKYSIIVLHIYKHTSEVFNNFLPKHDLYWGKKCLWRSNLYIEVKIGYQFQWKWSNVPNTYSLPHLNQPWRQFLSSLLYHNRKGWFLRLPLIFVWQTTILFLLVNSTHNPGQHNSANVYFKEISRPRF